MSVCWARPACSATLGTWCGHQPNPEVYARAAAQVKNCMDVTYRLGGQNYVLWAAKATRHSSTPTSRELDQLGRFLNQVVEYKHHIGFRGTILLEPKPQEPTKHQYDYDSQSCFAFLQRYGLEDEVKVNIEVNHATLSGHDFQHELAMAAACGILGSVDANRGDDRLGWDTDQFPNSVEEMSLGVYEILRAGGFDRRFNFDTKLRRMSIARDDLFHAHIGGMDTLADPARRSLDARGRRAGGRRSGRYAGWETGLGADILHGNGPGACLVRYTTSLRHEPTPPPSAVARRSSRTSSTASRMRLLMPFVAGVDSSTQSCRSRSAISTRSGHRRRPWRSSPDKPPRSEQDPNAWWAALVDAFGEVGSVAGQVAAIGVGASSTAWSCSTPTTGRCGPPSSGTTPSPPPKPPVLPRRSGPKPGPHGWVRYRSPRSR